MTTIAIDRHLDARWVPCPGPLMSLIDAIGEREEGDLIEMLADPCSSVDIHAWLRKADHEIVDQTEEDGHLRFVILKAA